MANPAPRLADMAANVRLQVIQAFRNWPFVRLANQGAGQRQVAPGHVAHNWLGIPPANNVMATGAEGVVHVWCDVHPTTRIIRDRVVVKHVVSGQVRYQDPANWVGQVGGEPLECHYANQVWTAMPAADRQHIQSCLGWGDVVPRHAPAAQQTYQYKLYHEYCSQSSLNRVMKTTQPRRKKKGAMKMGRKQLPEPFLWYMFESLAKACDAMNRSYPGVGLVHQDMHPGNIFFGDPDHNRFAKYPVLKVADFGSARRLTTSVRNRGSIVQNDPVCLPYAAPENSWIHPLPAHGPFAWEAPGMTLTMKTNIYQVGLIMASAIRLKNPLPENDWRIPPPNYQVPQANQLHHDNGPPIAPPVAPAGGPAVGPAGGPAVGVWELSRAQLNPGPKKYSAALTNLVAECLSRHHTQRPTAHQLLQRIQTQQQQHGRFQGMDAITLKSGPLTTAEKALCIDMVPDRYAIHNRF